MDLFNFHSKQTSCIEYHRVEEDWKNDALKLAWMKEDIQDDRCNAQPNKS